jgi:hypothetical protein
MYTDGVSGSVARTVLNSEQMNQLQEEIANVILDAGFALDKTRLKQLSEAVLKVDGADQAVYGKVGFQGEVYLNDVKAFVNSAASDTIRGSATNITGAELELLSELLTATGISVADILTHKIEDTNAEASMQIVSARNIYLNTVLGVVVGLSKSLEVAHIYPPNYLGDNADLNLHTFEAGNGKIINNAFSKLGGSTAPAIKQKLITGTSPAANGSVNIAHGIADYTKIISFDPIIRSSDNILYKPSRESASHDRIFYADINGTNIVVYVGPDASYMASRPFSCLITYTE